VLVEKTKLYDALYLNTGIKIHQLNSAVEKLEIDKSPEVAEIKNAHEMRKKLT